MRKQFVLKWQLFSLRPDYCRWSELHEANSTIKLQKINFGVYYAWIPTDIRYVYVMVRDYLKYGKWQLYKCMTVTDKKPKKPFIHTWLQFDIPIQGLTESSKIQHKIFVVLCTAIWPFKSGFSKNDRCYSITGTFSREKNQIFCNKQANQDFGKLKKWQKTFHKKVQKQRMIKLDKLNRNIEHKKVDWTMNTQEIRKYTKWG